MAVERESLTALVWERCPSKYGGTALLVLVKLAGLSKKDGYAWPSVEFLAKSCGVKPRAVQYILRRVKKDGVLALKRGSGGRHRFFLNRDAILKLDVAVPRDYREDAEAPDAEPKARPSALAQEFAGRLHKAISAEVREAQIPADWVTAWPAEIEKLVDAGHTDAEMRKAARFAINTKVWAESQLAPNGAHGFVKWFPAILEMSKMEVVKS